MPRISLAEELSISTHNMTLRITGIANPMTPNAARILFRETTRSSSMSAIAIAASDISGDSRYMS